MQFGVTMFPASYALDVVSLARAAEERAFESLFLSGHTHCAGPLAWMDPGEWRVHGGTNLINTGCWTDEPHINTHDPRSPYRPGYGVLVEDEGPPRLVRITENLGERPEHTF